MVFNILDTDINKVVNLGEAKFSYFTFMLGY
jgi:hypothetical protein